MKTNFITNFTLVSYTASMLLSAAAPVLAAGLDDGLRPAPAVNELPLEPDTQFDATRWYDEWWSTSVKGLGNIPAGFVNDFANVGKALKTVFKDGVKVGNVLIVRGGPDTAKIAKYHFEKMGIHYRDTITMFPEHAVAAGQEFGKAGKHIAKVAAANAADTAAVARYEGHQIVEDAKDTARLMGDVGKWMGRSYESAAITTGKDLKSDALQTGQNLENSVSWTARQEKAAVSDTARWMGDYFNADMKLTGKLANWTARQPIDGFNDTVEWTGDAAKATGRWTKAVAQGVAADMSETVSNAGSDIAAEHKMVVSGVNAVRHAVVNTLDAEGKFFDKAMRATADATFGNVPALVKGEIKNTKHDAKWLWKKGYQEGVKDGFELAGDNYFAGDVEGIAVGTFYSVAAVAQGVSYVLVLEPLAFTGHVGLGVTKTVGLTAAGVVGTGAVAATGIASEGATAIGGAAMTVGAVALGGVAEVATVGYEGGRIALHGVIDGGLVGGTAVVGGMATAGAATVGVVRTVGGTAIGAGATMTVATAGLLGGESLLVGAGALRMTGIGIAGTAMTAGSLALGGLRMTGDVAWGTTKMVGISAAGSVGELLIPTVDGVITSYRLGRIAGTAVVENAIITPAVATWDILSALTLGGWQLTRDPVLGTFHLVAGATGFSYRLAALSSTLAVTAVAGSLYALAHAPLSLVFYGGMWTIAAGGKLLDGITGPLAFGRQNKWKNERKPQLEEILGVQDESIKAAIGSKVTYIRVVFSGEDRGKVNFFTTENEGQTYRFRRKVLENCLVIYKSKDTHIELNSKLYDKQCVAGLAQ